jgi:thiosulfate reductase cytochrome b subunit
MEKMWIVYLLLIVVKSPLMVLTGLKYLANIIPVHVL